MWRPASHQRSNELALHYAIGDTSAPHLPLAQSSPWHISIQETIALAIRMQRWQGKKFPSACHRIHNAHPTFDFAIDWNFGNGFPHAFMRRFSAAGSNPSRRDCSAGCIRFLCDAPAIHPTLLVSTGYRIASTLHLNTRRVIDAMRIQEWIVGGCNRLLAAWIQGLYPA